MRISHHAVTVAALLSVLSLAGCVSPGYPYAPVARGVQSSGGFVSASPSYVTQGVQVLPYAYAPPQVIVAPSFYQGYGWGYWYGNRYWAYQPNCGFWRGQYYNGYRWNGYRPGFQGPPPGYQGGYQGYRGGSYGGYQQRGAWYR